MQVFVGVEQGDAKGIAAFCVHDFFLHWSWRCHSPGRHNISLINIDSKDRVVQDIKNCIRRVADASMAQPNLEITVEAPTTGQQVILEVVEREDGVAEDVGAKSMEHNDSLSTSGVVAVINPPAMASVSQQSTPEAPSSVPPARPSLVPLGSSNVQPSPSTSVGPHPKRFSAVNINKKFLEKTTASGLPANTSSASSMAKAGSPGTLILTVKWKEKKYLIFFY
jgi:hypothetical protein